MYYFVSYRCTATKRDVSRECLEVLVCSGLSTSGSSPVCNCLLQTNGYHVRGGDPSDLRMSMKNSLPVNQKTREVVTSWLWRTHGQWFCFPFCVRQYVPSVLWCSESFFRSIVCCENKKKTPLLATTQVQLWPKMAQELNPHCWWKPRSRHNNTEKSNGTLLIQLQHSPYSFFLNPLLSGCKFFGDFVSSFLKLKLTQSFFSVYKIRMKILKKE